MGTKVHSKSYLPGFYSMRDLNEDCSSSSWPFFYGEKTVPNGQYYNGFVPRNLVDGYHGHEKDAMKQKILEHEAVFKNQVCELHRLYRIQRDMMEEAKRKDSYKYRASVEPAASSSSLQGPQMPSEDNTRKWHMAGFPLLNSSCYGRTSTSGAEIVNSPMSCTKGYSPAQPSQSPFQNRSSLKESEVFDSRPSKVRKKLFDLQLPADEYIDDEGEKSSRAGKIGLADLNEPILIEDDFQGPNTENGDRNHHGKQNTGYLGVAGEKMDVRDGFLMNSKFENKVSESGLLSRVYGAGSNRLNQGHHPPGIYPSGNYSREELWIEGRQRILESSDRTRDNSNTTPAPYPFFNSSCFPTSWSHSALSWANPTNGFPQKVNALETSLNSAAATSRSLHGFCHASSSGYRELEKVHAFDNAASDRSSNHGFGEFSKGSTHADSKPTIDINLNEQDFSVTDGKSKNEEHLSVLPWLKPKNEKVRDLNQVFIPKENAETEKPIRKILGFPIFERGVQENKNVSNERKNGIIDINVACEELIASEESTVERENHKDGALIRNHIDLNSCVSDSEDISTPCFEGNRTNVKITLEIDLEVPLFPDSEDDSALPSKENKLEGKINKQAPDEVLRDAAEAIISISLWGPQVQTETGPSLSESLLWFANEIEKHQRSDSSEDEEIDDFEEMTLQLPETKEEDYMPKSFVPELPKTEETVPTSLQTRSRRGQSRRGRQRRDFQRDILPGLTSLSRHEVTEDIQIFGGLMRATGHSWNSGPTRRNGSGRGRKRAVVEVGPISVVPGGVCSAPLIQQLNSIETGLEDRSLTGWGKTTRRPRRQRLPSAGNSAAVALIQ